MVKTITVTTKKREQFIDITAPVQEALEASGIKDGLAIVFCPHTTAGLTINENADPDVVRDIISHLDRLVPPGGNYSHREGNADSHIKASLLGSSLNIIVRGRQLVLGTWQGIYFCEFDGPRTRQTHITFLEA